MTKVVTSWPLSVRTTLLSSGTSRTSFRKTNLFIYNIFRHDFFFQCSGQCILTRVWFISPFIYFHVKCLIPWLFPSWYYGEEIFSFFPHIFICFPVFSINFVDFLSPAWFYLFLWLGRPWGVGHCPAAAARVSDQFVLSCFLTCRGGWVKKNILLCLFALL